MSTGFDPVEIAEALAEIASKTREPHTARQLMELVKGLLTSAGLPSEEYSASTKG